jgi:hypothetical protein
MDFLEPTCLADLESFASRDLRGTREFERRWEVETTKDSAVELRKVEDVVDANYR